MHCFFKSESFFFVFLFFYFINLLLATFCRKQLTYKGVFFVLTLNIFVIFFSLTLNIFRFCFFSPSLVCEIDFLSLNWFFLDLTISLNLDLLSFFFVLLVSAIGFCTNIYVLNYFKYEANEDLFSLLLNWFIFSMIILVLANNFFTLFLGWELIGLVSFFLINFWSSRRGTLKSSFKALSFNRFSDFLLFVFIVSSSSLFHVNDIPLFNINVFFFNVVNVDALQILTWFLVGCSLFKSAQLIGHLWLPDSMEAPVPASALIHSATLVSAGLYLLLRFGVLLASHSLTDFIMVIGSVTAAYGGVVSASQTDMKKLLAYSTISHCGFLFVTVGLGSYFVTVIYLFLHGLFKASTFFCSGSFIRVANSQDTRQMGSLSRLMPVDTALILICCFNLGGLPFSIGYLYKSSLIIALLNTPYYFLILGFCFLALLTGLVYSFRLVYYSCFDITKFFLPSILFMLQQKKINITKYWSLTTYVQLFASLCLIVFSLCVYVFFYTYVYESQLLLDFSPLKLLDFYNVSNSSSTWYLYFYEFFYNFYLLLFLILYLLSWRVDYTFISKNFITIYFILGLVFSLIFSNIISLI